MPWRAGQRCIIPAEAFYEPDWRSCKAVLTRIARVDGEPMGIAELWSWWKSLNGGFIHRFAMLTINADDHALKNRFHKPTDENRMVVVLPEGAYQGWLEPPLNRVGEFLVACAADSLVATAG